MGKLPIFPGSESSGQLVDRVQLVEELDEPLLESAPIAFQVARQNCSNNCSDVDCSAYHAIWQYLRLSGTMRSMRVDGPLFVRAAEQLARAGRLKRVLISGSADYSMLAHLAFGALRGGAKPRFDVVDACDTPLQMNRWLADKRGIDLRCVKSDIFAFAPTERYDLICTHTFLGWHPAETKGELFRLWGDWLAPQGWLCFSDRITPARVVFDPEGRAERLECMAQNTLSSLRSIGVQLPCEEPDFAALVRKVGDRNRADRQEMTIEMLQGWMRAAGLVPGAATEISKLLGGADDPTFLTGNHRERPRMWFQAHRP